MNKEVSKWVIAGIAIFVLQAATVDFFTIKSIRPDFLFIYLLYLSLQHGSLAGVVAGFFIGLLEDLAGVGSYFGLLPLIMSSAGYFFGKLKGRRNNMNTYIFHLLRIFIFLVYFWFYSYVRFQSFYEESLFTFLIMWFIISAYSLFFLIASMLIKPLPQE